MISKNLFFRVIKQEWKQRIWCPLCIFVFYFLLLEVQLLLRLQDMERWPGNFDYSKAHFFANTFLTPDGNDYLTVVTCITAVLCACCVFSYIHVRKKLDLVHSLPVRREMIFGAKYIAGILFYIIPVLVHLLISFMIGVNKEAYSTHGLKNVFGFLAIETLFFVLVYTATIVAILLTGNIIVSLLLTVALLPYSYILSWLKRILYDRFYYSSISKYVEDIWAFSPIHMVIKFCENTKKYKNANKGFSYTGVETYSFLLILAVIVLLVLAVFLYKKRATEAAGKPIAFSVAEPLIKCMIVIPAALFSGELVCTVADSGSAGGWYLFGIVFGFLVSCIALEIVFRQDMKAAFRHWTHIIFNGACIALIVMIFKSDALGYNTFIPAQSEIESLGVSITGLFDYYTEDYIEESTDISTYRLEHVNLKNKEHILTLVQKLSTQGLHYKEFIYYEGIEKTPEYKENLQKEKNYRNIAVCYRLTNGKKVYRNYYYDITEEESVKLVADIFNDGDYKLGSTPLFRDGWNKEIIEINCRSNWYDETLRLSDEQQNRLMDAYQSEFMKLTFEQVMEQVPIGAIEFAYKNENGRWFYCDGYKIYPTFTRTIALLKEYGFDYEKVPDMDDIKKAVVTIYDYEKFYGTQGTFELEYKEREQIQEIFSSVLSYGIYDSSLYMPVDDTSYDIAFHLVEDGEVAIRYMVFKKDCIPYFIHDDVEEQEQE